MEAVGKTPILHAPGCPGPACAEATLGKPPPAGSLEQIGQCPLQRSFSTHHQGGVPQQAMSDSIVVKPLCLQARVLRQRSAMPALLLEFAPEDSEDRHLHIARCDSGRFPHPLETYPG